MASSIGGPHLSGAAHLRPLALADAPAFQQLYNDRAIAATTFMPYPLPDGFIEGRTTMAVEGYEKGEFAYFVVVLRDSGLLIGSIGLVIN